MRCRTLIEGAPQVGKARVDLNSVTTVGLDLAKHVFQIHAVDADGRIVIATALRRRDVLSFFAPPPPCVIGLEACGSAHHWARELVKLGHVARLMLPNYVKAYVGRQKNDAADAAAICEAVTRPSMRFVPIGTIDNQAVLMRHKVREILVSQRTQLLNALRGHLAEIGIVAAQGPNGADALAATILKGDSSIPALRAKCPRADHPSVANPQQRDRRERPRHHGAGKDGWDSSTADERSGDWPDNRLRDCCKCSGCWRILGPAGVRSVPRTGAETELVRGQGAPWTRIKNGESLPPKAVGHRRPRCPLPPKVPSGWTQNMGGEAHGN
jgi:transposase